MPLALPALKLGSSGAEVGNWQRFLAAALGDLPLTADESFGPRTRQATKIWQLANKLVTDGVVGPRTRDLAVSQGFIQFLQAKNFTRPSSSRSIDRIVIHDMEYPERPEGAEWCAQFFAGVGGMTAPRASAHYSVDSDSVVQSVRDGDVAWHAPGANHNGIGIEHAGYARQRREEWLDDYSRRELEVSARLTARLCRLYAIPVEYLDFAALKAGKRGLTGHRDVSSAFGGSHWDPGESFPWDVFVSLVTSAGRSLTPSAGTRSEDDSVTPSAGTRSLTSSAGTRSNEPNGPNRGE